MMFRAADMKSDAYVRSLLRPHTRRFYPRSLTRCSFSMVSNWVEGGYSDDMIVGAVCERHARGIGWAPALLFPSRCRRAARRTLPRALVLSNALYTLLPW